MRTFGIPLWISSWIYSAVKKVSGQPKARSEEVQFFENILVLQGLFIAEKREKYTQRYGGVCTKQKNYRHTIRQQRVHFKLSR